MSLLECTVHTVQLSDQNITYVFSPVFSNDLVAKTKSNANVPRIKVDGDKLHKSTFDEISTFVYLSLVMWLISLLIFSAEIGHYKNTNRSPPKSTSQKFILKVLPVS